MYDLSSGVNITPRTNTSMSKNGEEIDIGNTIQYYVKSYQVKTTIVNFPKIRQKVFKLNRPHKYMLVQLT